MRSKLNTLCLPVSLSILVGLKEVTLCQDEPHLAADPDSDHKVLQHWTNLEFLAVHCVLGKISVWIAKLTSLRHLILSHIAEGSDVFLTHASCMTALPLEAFSFRLDRGAQKWIGWPSFCTALQAISSLRAVGLQNIDLSAGRLACSPQITRLGLTHTRLDCIPAAITSLSRLYHVDLASNCLTEIPAGPYLEALQHLDLRCYNFQQLPMQLLKARHLHKLLLPGCLEHCRGTADDKQLRQHLEPQCTIEFIGLNTGTEDSS